MRNAIQAFTLIEVLVFIAVAGLLAGVSMKAFGSFERSEALEANASSLAAGLRDARSRTLASVNGLQYGVYIDQDRYTIFQGSSYVSEASANRSYLYGSLIRATSTISSFVFSKVSGNSSASGTISVYVKSDPSKTRSVQVQSTGLISIQ